MAYKASTIVAVKAASADLENGTINISLANTTGRSTELLFTDNAALEAATALLGHLAEISFARDNSQAALIAQDVEIQTSEDGQIALIVGLQTDVDVPFLLDRSMVAALREQIETVLARISPPPRH